jgi:hypothetical protein
MPGASEIYWQIIPASRLPDDGQIVVVDRQEGSKGRTVAHRVVTLVSKAFAASGSSKTSFRDWFSQCARKPAAAPMQVQAHPLTNPHNIPREENHDQP